MSEEAPIVSEYIDKVVIVPYTDKNFNQRDSVGLFALPVNPETYTRTFKVEYDTRRGQGNQGTNPKFKSAPPEELKLEFMFDSTGTIMGYHYNLGSDEDMEEGKAVDKQICKFLKTVYKVSGNTHKPNYLKIFWGTLQFPCVMTNVDINYTLFNEFGNPIRAKASATFKQYLSPDFREREAKKCSPDVTHQQLIKAGDRIDILVEDVYNTTGYVLSVARANDLTSIRQLPIGTQFVLPPLEKRIS